MKVRRPVYQLDARGHIATHGHQVPVRGVWHDTEGHDAAGIRDLQGIVNYWIEQDLGYGAAVIIDKSGNSALCADPDRITWAVENHNTGTVSIELVGFAKFTPSIWRARGAQLDKLARWMAWLRLEYGIPLDLNVNKGWSGHADQTRAFGGSHTDPGIGFPKRYVLRKARSYYKTGW
jgi:hypothetical protein